MLLKKMGDEKMPFKLNDEVNLERIMEHWNNEIILEQTTWGQYYVDYMASIGILLESEEPFNHLRIRSLLFLIRHSLELGLKEYIMLFNNYLAKTETNLTHKLSELYPIFCNLYEEMSKKYNFDEVEKNEFYTYKARLESLKSIFEKLDDLSMTFRYPTDRMGDFFFKKNNGIDMEEKVDMIEIIDLLSYTNEMFFALHSSIYIFIEPNYIAELEKDVEEAKK